MTSLINYIFEANGGLLLLLIFYKIILKEETNFKLLRFFLLGGILLSILFPLIHIGAPHQNNIPTLSEVMPKNWLPEIIVTGESYQSNATQPYSIWMIIGGVYGTGVLLSMTLMLVRIMSLIAVMRNQNTYKLDKFHVIESAENKPTFSFFNFIYIGNARTLTPYEKERIIQHETVHARQLHSLDILLVSLLGVFFWFNPFIKTYKKVFVQLHEFEADARAVENADADKYCNLLARVALQSADFKLANHFNNSLTLKRIQMMRTIKSKIKGWKIIACSAIVPILFFFIACQDQITGETKPGIPAEAQERFLEFQKNYPGETFIVEYDENADARLAELENKYGKATHIVLFTIQVDGKSRDFSMIQYGPSQEKIFTIVEQQPEFPGGIDPLMNFLRENIRYPLSSRQAGHEGTVYVEMVIDKDGSVTEVKAMKGVDQALDAEAVRVVKLLPRWKPGSQNGRNVRTQFIIPIKFKLDLKDKANTIIFDPLQPKEHEMKIIWTIRNVGNKRVASGQVLDESGNPLKGTNLIIKGTSRGVSTGHDGKFSLEIPNGNGEVTASFIGYKTTSLSY